MLPKSWSKIEDSRTSGHLQSSNSKLEVYSGKSRGFLWIQHCQAAFEVLPSTCCPNFNKSRILDRLDRYLCVKMACQSCGFWVDSCGFDIVRHQLRDSHRPMSRIVVDYQHLRFFVSKWLPVPILWILGGFMWIRHRATSTEGFPSTDVKDCSLQVDGEVVRGLVGGVFGDGESFSLQIHFLRVSLGIPGLLKALE